MVRKRKDRNRGSNFSYPKVEVAPVYIKIDGEVVGHTRRRKIFLTSPNTGRLSDGRPVKKIRGRWYYIA